MKKVVEKLVKKVFPKKTDDLLEVEPGFELVMRAFGKDPQVTTRKMMSSVELKAGGKISMTDPKQPWLAFAREAYRFVKSSR